MAQRCDYLPPVHAVTRTLSLHNGSEGRTINNIILQHWSGELSGIAKLSVDNISEYAKRIGVEYRLLRGNLFHPGLTAPCQKLHMLSDEFDDYDMVVMLDADMFVRRGMTENVFTDTDGIGRHTDIQEILHGKLVKAGCGSPDHPYWGGAIYRLDRELRQGLRAKIGDIELFNYNGAHFEDEGIMNLLAMKAGVPITDGTYLDGNHWDCGNFEDGVEQCAMIHLRPKMFKDGTLVRTPKTEAYADMVDRGLI